MAEGEKLENPFAKSAGAGGSNNDRDGFLAFSSSTPRGSPSGGGPRGFRPKWGKANRQDNWRRFGQYNDQEQQRMNMSAPNGEFKFKLCLNVHRSLHQQELNFFGSHFRNDVAVTRRSWFWAQGLPRFATSTNLTQLSWWEGKLTQL